MATRPPAPLLPRRPKVSQRKATAFPVLPMAAATLVLLGVAQLMIWWWDARLPDAPGTLKPKAENPFVALPQVLERMTQPAKPRAKVQEVQRLRALPLPQNLQFGDAMGAVTVTIFTDPSCGQCRAEVLNFTMNLPVKGVRQIYKFWPIDPQRLTPGLLVELARRNGVTLPFWRSVHGSGRKDLDDAAMLSLLAEAGIPYNEQRAALTNDASSLGMALEPDIALAKSGNLPPPPVFVVDEYVVDGQVLNPKFLKEYVQKRLDGRQLFENTDLFLMDRRN